MDLECFSNAEISELVTCEGKTAEFICVLDNGRAIDDVQWYRVIKDTGITEMVDQQDSNIHITTSTINNTLTSQLTITNSHKSHTGYYWFGTPSLIICNASLSVHGVASMHIEFLIHNMHNTK